MEWADVVREGEFRLCIVFGCARFPDKKVYLMLVGRKPREYHRLHRSAPSWGTAYIIYDAVKRLAENPQVSADSGR